MNYSRYLSPMSGLEKKSSSEEIDLKALAYKYLISKWYLYLIFMSAFVAYAYFHLATVEPAYQVSCKMLIRESGKEGGDTEDMLRRSLNMAGSSENVSNELHLIRSYALMYDVVEKLNLDVKYFQQHRFSTTDSYHNFPVIIDSYALSSDKYYYKSFQIQPVDECNFRFIADGATAVYPYGEKIDNSYGTFRFMKNEGYVDQGPNAEMFLGFQPLADVARGYLGNLQTKLANDNSTTLELFLTDVVPQRGLDVLEKLIELYNKYTIEDKNKIASSTLKFLDDRLYEINLDLKNVEQRVENFKLNNNIAAETGDDLNIVFENVSKLADEQKDLEVQLSMLDAMQSHINATANRFELFPSNISSIGGYLVDLVEPYNKLVLEREQMLKNARITNPAVVSLTERLNSLRGSIVTTIDNTRRDLAMNMSKIQTQFNDSKLQLRSVPGKERGLLEIQRQQKIIENLYIYLLEKREETALSLIATNSNSRVIDPPRSSQFAISPNKKITYLGSLLGGFILPFLLVLGSDMLKDSIRSEEEIRGITNYSILGSIAHNRSKKDIVVGMQTRSAISEHFRSVRTNLRFFYKSNPQVMLVTSSVSGEGKSFIASNLAVSFALVKKRTVIVDFDMRKPKLNQYLKQDPDAGLSNFLVDAEQLKDIIVSTKINDNLDFIASGPIPPSPSELITDDKMAELFTYLRANYEVIIVDSPPIGLVSDAVLINKYITNSLYVVRYGFTKKQMLEDAHKVFEQNKLISPAFIFNDVKDSSSYGKYKNSYYGN